MADIQESEENKEKDDAADYGTLLQNTEEQEEFEEQELLQKTEEQKEFEEEQELQEEENNIPLSERILPDIKIEDTLDKMPTREEFEGEQLFYPHSYIEMTGTEGYEVSSQEPFYREKFQFEFGEYGDEEKYYYPQESEQGKYVYPEKIPGEVEEEESSASSLSQVYSKLSPFFIKWSFGVKTATKMINLTKHNQFEVFYAVSHFGVIYDYRRNSMRFLPGHNSHVSSIAADERGRWLVTADSGNDSVIIIWDHECRIPSWCLYNIFKNKGTKCVQISPDARFLAAVSDGPDQTFKFYQWTYGKDEADGEIKIDPEQGVAIHIQFSHVNTCEFAITLGRKVMFCLWNPEYKNIENIVVGPKKHKGKVGTFVQTLYLDDTHSAITSTTEGAVLIWSDTVLLNHTNKKKPSTIMKKYLKSLKIHTSIITSLQLIDGIIVSSSGDGMISFHDQALSLLYWVPKYIFEPVVNVSCNLNQQHAGQLDPFSDDFDNLASSKRSTSDENIQDLISDESSVNGSYEQSSDVDEEQNTERNISFSSPKATEPFEKLKQRQMPFDCTIEMRPFYMRDFIFLTYNGKFGYVSHYRAKVRYFLNDCVAQVLSLDCNPNKSHLAIGNSSGIIDLYEYREKKLLFSSNIANKGITCLKYTPSGHFLTAGLSNGEIFFLDSILLEVKMKLNAGKSEILKMCFSRNEKFFAFFDRANIVYVHRKSNDNLWIFIGAYKSHYKPIKDIIFDEDFSEKDNKKVPRLFSIGEDRMLVEYDIKNEKSRDLSLKSTDRIEQTAIPQCMTLIPKFNDKVYFLISNSEYKFKIIERNEKICCKTTVGPTAESPVNFMKIIESSDHMSRTKMIYTTEKHIGLRLMPPTGNPFEGTGMFGHPVKITGIAISHDFKYIFTIGLNDNSVLMWKVNYKSVDIAHQLGGNGIEPFIALIEGGRDGFLFKEIQDFYYYAQIIHQGEHANLDRSVVKTIALCEIPDFFRSLGYYPTEYEIDNIFYEIRHLNYDTSGELVNEISFDDCVKIYLNHRPVAGISIDSIHKALLTIADLSDPESIIVEREELYKALEERAEAMSHEEVVGYLCILLFTEDEKNPVPSTMTLKDFADDVLGIDLNISEENVREITHPSEIRKKK